MPLRVFPYIDSFFDSAYNDSVEWGLRISSPLLRGLPVAPGRRHPCRILKSGAQTFAIKHLRQMPNVRYRCPAGAFYVCLQIFLIIFAFALDIYKIFRTSNPWGRCLDNLRSQPRSSATATSLTLVPVGPVTISPSTAFKAW